MSRFFAKRLYQTPLLAVKPSHIFRLPTRCLNTSANVYSGSVLKVEHNDDASGNAKASTGFTLQGGGCLFDRVSKLEDRFHHSDLRFISSDRRFLDSDDRYNASVKEFAKLEDDLRKDNGRMSSRMETTMAKHYGEHKSDTANLFANMGMMYGGHKSDIANLIARMERSNGRLGSDMAKLSADMGRMHGELRSDMGKMHGELKVDIAKTREDLKTDIAQVGKRLGEAEGGINSLRLYFRLTWAAALLVAGYIRNYHPGLLPDFVVKILERIIS